MPKRLPQINKKMAIDAAAGLGAGVGVPVVSKLAIENIQDKPEFLATDKNQRYLAGGLGVLASVGVGYWRGAAPMTLGLLGSVGYVLAPWLREKVSGAMSSIGGGSNANAAVTEGLRGRRNTGLLTSRQVGRNTGMLQVRRAGAPASIMQGNASVWGPKPFGGVSGITGRGY